jgi:hypothetical protein
MHDEGHLLPTIIIMTCPLNGQKVSSDAAIFAFVGHMLISYAFAPPPLQYLIIRDTRPFPALPQTYV